jgi:diadenylate cyclase
MTISISAIIQIAILYWAIYSILKAAKGSRFGQVLFGVGILTTLLIAFSYLFKFDVLSRIVQFLLAYLAISTVVIFQPEIRRILSTVGAFGYLEKPKYSNDGKVTSEHIIEIIMKLAGERIGALIAFERGISLRGYENSGVMLDAIFSEPLVRSIFTPPMPLHDGGATVRNGRISSAHTIFPVSNNPNLMSNGMRHRAAVGLSEETDALVVVISEETGAVSVAYNGKLFKYSLSEASKSLPYWLDKAVKHRQTAAGALYEKFNGQLNRFVFSKVKGN